MPRLYDEVVLERGQVDITVVPDKSTPDAAWQFKGADVELAMLRPRTMTRIRWGLAAMAYRVGRTFIDASWRLMGFPRDASISPR